MLNNKFHLELKTNSKIDFFFLLTFSKNKKKKEVHFFYNSVTQNLTSRNGKSNMKLTLFNSTEQ